MIPWEIEADELVTCNCDYGCPCQFNALPTHGHCQAVAGFSIKRGHFGDVKLDGLRSVGVLKWPGAIHEGGGVAFAIIDESASEEQRNAMLQIMGGKETDPFATMWSVFASTLADAHPPQFRKIDIEIDVEERTGHVRVDGVVDVSGEPIRNPVSGEVHRARIDLIGGFEYEVAEMGSATANVTGPFDLGWENAYAQFAHIHLNNHGIVSQRDAA